MVINMDNGNKMTVNNTIKAKDCILVFRRQEKQA